MEYLGGGSCLDLVNTLRFALSTPYVLTTGLAETGRVQRSTCGYYLPAITGRPGLFAL